MAHLPAVYIKLASSTTILLLILQIPYFVQCGGKFGFLQKYAVTGQLLCKSSPSQASSAVVKLIDKDTISKDDLLNTTQPFASGKFTVSGETREFSRINPMLLVIHDCKDGFEPGQRVLRLKLNQAFINKKAPLELKDINLEVPIPGEERFFDRGGPEGQFVRNPGPVA